MNNEGVRKAVEIIDYDKLDPPKKRENAYSF
jgi:hypothetical protein